MYEVLRLNKFLYHLGKYFLRTTQDLRSQTTLNKGSGSAKKLKVRGHKVIFIPVCPRVETGRGDRQESVRHKRDSGRQPN